MKKLYQFSFNKDEDVELDITSTNESGETVITKKKETKSVPYNFFIAKPTRSMMDSASLFNSAEVNRGVKAGLSSIYVVERRYKDEGGVFNAEDNSSYAKLINELVSDTQEIEKLAAIPETERFPEHNKQKEELTQRIAKTRISIQEFERVKSNLYVHTAEYRARNLLIVWWVLNLSYKEENGKEIPYFGNGTHEERLKAYDALSEQEDPFITKVLERFLYTISFWVINGPEKQEDFKDLDKLIEESKANEAKN